MRGHDQALSGAAGTVRAAGSYRGCGMCVTGNARFRSACSPGPNTLIPVTAGLPPWSRASPAHLTASLPHTGAGDSVTTASIRQRLRHSPPLLVRRCRVRLLRGGVAGITWWAIWLRKDSG